MKRLLLITIATALLTLASCKSKSYKQGAEFADRFAKCWTDSAQRAEVVADIESEFAKLDDAARDDFKKGLYDRLSEAGDEKALIAAKAVTTDEETFLVEMTGEIVDGLKGSMSSEDAFRLMQLTRSVMQTLGRQSKAFEVALDNRVRELPTTEQMRVYAKSTTPEKLGVALRADRNRSDAEAKAVDERAEALKSIYTKEEYQRFLSTFNPK